MTSLIFFLKWNNSWTAERVYKAADGILRYLFGWSSVSRLPLFSYGWQRIIIIIIYKNVRNGTNDAVAISSRTGMF